MSLQVWLPLTKDLRNQGLSNVTVNGGIIDNNGKLGKCYLVTKTNPIVITQSVSVTSEWTISFWAKLPSSMDNATVWEVMFRFPTIAADTGADSTSNINWTDYHNIKIWDDSNHQWFWAIPGRHFNYDKWHIWTIAHTANGNGVTGKIYIDGNLIGTYNNTTHQMKIRPGSIIIGGGISTGGFYINDFRLYNHCLSPMEIKEISKGLILHYPLNRNGWGQENLATCNTVQYNLAASTANWNYFWITSSTALEPNTTYTFSAEVEVSDNYERCTVYNYTASGKSGEINYYFPADGKRHSWTFTTTSNALGLIAYAGTAGSTANYSAIYKKIKLEKGSVATPWCPNSTDVLATTMGLNDNVEYDTSGYCNNGTRTGTFSWTSDTPKYQVSTKFNTTSTKIKLPVISFTGMANSYTFAWWQYNISTGNMPWGFSDGNRLNCYHCSPLCWNTGDGSSNQFKDGSTTVTPATIQNGWHHMVITGDGTATKLYIDGVYKGTAITYKPLTGTQIWISGWDSGTLYTFSGSKECDFRIYATALSAEDVKSLYQNSAYIDNQGNIYGAVYEEV